MKTTHKAVSEMWARRYCIKPIVLEKVLLDLNADPMRASYEFRGLSMLEAQDLLFRKLDTMPLAELEAAPWY